MNGPGILMDNITIHLPRNKHFAFFFTEKETIEHINATAPTIYTHSIDSQKQRDMLCNHEPTPPSPCIPPHYHSLFPFLKPRSKNPHPNTFSTMLIPLLLGTALQNFLPNATTTVTNIFHKVAFDLDTIGRARQTSFIEESARVAYTNAGLDVNIAVWNMHIPEAHHFERILETGLQPMGRGGGFRVVVFQGKGWLRNDGRATGDAELKYSGKNLVVKGNTVVFRDVDACTGLLWGRCILSNYGGGEWMQKLLW
ncbi:hypothetical protein yc1106_02343 [Curvularia clavata]|uniref:Uncharacterized protein n=1 Tax=Curvularia clavata TaxID=95742 RepID=A0A9Q9DQU8_CURCL|nr:hypothetical protein yc1106_02343 [Curvularia clavata]